MSQSGDGFFAKYPVRSEVVRPADELPPREERPLMLEFRLLHERGGRTAWAISYQSLYAVELETPALLWLRFTYYDVEVSGQFMEGVVERVKAQNVWLVAERGEANAAEVATGRIAWVDKIDVRRKGL